MKRAGEANAVKKFLQPENPLDSQRSVEKPKRTKNYTGLSDAAYDLMMKKLGLKKVYGRAKYSGVRYYTYEPIPIEDEA